jgi:hypothetical protein
MTLRLDHRSTNAPAIGAKIEKGARRAISITAVTSGAAEETARASPSAAMKLNQFPSSDTT